MRICLKQATAFLNYTYCFCFRFIFCFNFISFFSQKIIKPFPHQAITAVRYTFFKKNLFLILSDKTVIQLLYDSWKTGIKSWKMLQEGR